MSRTFLYARVSTTDQNPSNQLLEVQTSGFQVDPKRMVAESISGSVAAKERPGFAKLLDRLEEGDVLIVTKLDRLGRNASDVRATVDKLSQLGVRVHCLALGGMDLNSAAGKMTMGVIASVAEFERDLLIERTTAGLVRAKAEGKVIGRPRALTDAEQASVCRRLDEGESMSALAREFKTTRQTISRIRKRVKDNAKAKASAQASPPTHE